MDHRTLIDLSRRKEKFLEEKKEKKKKSFVCLRVDGGKKTKREKIKIEKKRGKRV